MSEAYATTANLAQQTERLEGQSAAEKFLAEAEDRFSKLTDSLAVAATKSANVIVGFANSLDPRKSRAARLVAVTALGFVGGASVANAESYESQSPLKSPVGALVAPEQQ